MSSSTDWLDLFHRKPKHFPVSDSFTSHYGAPPSQLKCHNITFLDVKLTSYHWQSPLKLLPVPQDKLLPVPVFVDIICIEQASSIIWPDSLFNDGSMVQYITQLRRAFTTTIKTDSKKEKWWERKIHRNAEIFYLLPGECCPMSLLRLLVSSRFPRKTGY